MLVLIDEVTEMNIELSEQTAEKFAAVIGSADPQAIGRFLERMADDEQLLQSFFLDRRTEEEIRQSAADCDRAMESIKAGQGKPFEEAMQSIRARLDFETPE